MSDHSFSFDFVFFSDLRVKRALNESDYNNKCGLGSINTYIKPKVRTTKKTSIMTENLR